MKSINFILLLSVFTVFIPSMNSEKKPYVYDRAVAFRQCMDICDSRVREKKNYRYDCHSYCKFRLLSFEASKDDWQKLLNKSAEDKFLDELFNVALGKGLEKE